MVHAIYITLLQCSGVNARRLNDAVTNHDYTYINERCHKSRTPAAAVD